MKRYPAGTWARRLASALRKRVASSERGKAPNSQAGLEDLGAAYRLFFGREPDAAGFAHHAQLIEDGMSLDQLRDAFLASPEFRSASGPKIRTVDVGGGLKVSIDEREPEFGRAIAHGGTWEPHIVGQITSALDLGYTFVDIGANVGIMSFHASRRVGDTGTIIAFEPDRENAARFLEGMRANDLANVTLYQLALSNRRSIASLAGGSNTYLTDAGPKRLVQTVPGDAILLGQSRIDLVKIDIEGFEPLALEGLSGTLKRHGPRILCEFNPRCLKDHASVAPDHFATQIFSLADRVSAIEHDGTENEVRTPAGLMELWRLKNADAVKTGMLPDGMLHLDLLFDASH